jgi:transcription elongation factor GreA
MSDLAAPANADSKLTDLYESLGEGDSERIENLWMEILEDTGQLASTVNDLSAFAAEGLRQGQDSIIKPLLELTWGALSDESGGSDDSGAVESAAALSGVAPAQRAALGQVMVRAFPARKEYLAVYLDAFLEENGPMSAERAFFNACDIENATDKVAALDRFSKLLQYRAGAVVYHESGWGIGEILEVDALLGQVRVDLEEKKDHRISIEAVDSILDILPEGTFRCMLYHGSEELARLVEEDPIELVQKVLHDYGNPLPQKEIKARMIEGAIDSANWTRWWTRTKKKLRDSGFFRIGDRSPYLVEQLEEAVSFEDELLSRFRLDDWVDCRSAARQIIKGGQKKYPAAYPEVASGLQELLGRSSNKTKAFEICLLLSRVKQVEETEEAEVSWVEFMEAFSVDEICEALDSLPVGENPRKVFKLLGETRPADQLSVALKAFQGRSDNLRKVAFETIDSIDPKELKDLCSQICASPRLSPEACIWLLGCRLAGKEGTGIDLLSGKTSRELVILLMDLLEHLIDKEVRAGRNAVKELMKKVETLLYYSDGEIFKEAVDLMESAERKLLYKRVLRQQAQLPLKGPRFLEAISTADPSVNQEDKIPDWENPEIIFSTEAGRGVIEEENRELQDEKLPAIFKAIGDAAELGDLSENAEFTSACEERDNLVRKAEQIQEDLEKVQIIDSSMVTEGVVGLGSRVRAENMESGEVVFYSVLGPWDGGPEEGVLNYRSPLGQFFLGKEVDDEVEVVLPGGTSMYRILEITSIFD